VLLSCRELADSEQATSFSKNTQAGDEQDKESKDIDDVKVVESDETESDAEKAETGDGKDLTGQWSRTILKKEYRKFNLDLAPKVTFLQNNLVYIRKKSHYIKFLSQHCFSFHVKREMWLT
jgi:hypothetical protein